MNLCDALMTCYVDSHMRNMYKEGDEDTKHTASDRGYATLS
jgi:hypothetical protein